MNQYEAQARSKAGLRLAVVYQDPARKAEDVAKDILRSARQLRGHVRPGHWTTQPPPALYAMMELSAGALSVPLHAQSPLPYRIDAEEMKRDLIDGVVRRKAVFRWHTARYLGSKLAAFLVKQDRNGQTYLPADDKGFEIIEKVTIAKGLKRAKDQKSRTSKRQRPS